jgi:hypothetical protein
MENEFLIEVGSDAAVVIDQVGEAVETASWSWPRRIFDWETTAPQMAQGVDHEVHSDDCRIDPAFAGQFAFYGVGKAA